MARAVVRAVISATSLRIAAVGGERCAAVASAAGRWRYGSGIVSLVVDGDARPVSERAGGARAAAQPVLQRTSELGAVC